MCNWRHTNSTPIPENGYGWKLFDRTYRYDKPRGKRRLFSLVTKCEYNRCGRSSYAKWGRTFGKGAGFCFFLTRREAVLAKRYWGEEGVKIVKIKYRKGMCQHVETGFISKGIRMALCKEFRLDASVKECRL